MTTLPERTRAQAPGIGGPVDLAGIARYRKQRTVARFMLLAVMIAAVISAAEGWLAWPAEFPLRRWLPPSGMVMQGYVCAILALSILAGNRTENRLVYLTAALSAGLGVAMAAGCAALFFVLEPASPPSWRIAIPFLAGLAAAAALTGLPTFLAEGRRKRLETGSAEEAAA